MIDQFITSFEDKWKWLSGLAVCRSCRMATRVLFSSTLERASSRYLSGVLAEQNIQVAQPYDRWRRCSTFCAARSCATSASR